MKPRLLAAAILGLAAAGLFSITLPPARLALPTPFSDGSIPGVVHVHTNRSDGQSGIDLIAAAAARAGLKFVVFTDHGDATAPPQPPAYRGGVLCIDAVEISTSGGHVVALDMPAAPYPLAGEPAAVIEDIHRLGGFAIAAHPDSPRPELRWRDWEAPVDGVETLNLDTGWRTWAQRAGLPGQGTAPVGGGDQGSSPWRARARLLTALLGYPFRPVETIGALSHARANIGPYAALIERRRVISIAGADAHARLEYRGDGSGSGPSLPLPGYLPTFRAMSVHVTTERPFTGDPIEDGRLVVAAIRAGRLYTVVDALATPASIEFSAANASGTARPGDLLAPGGAIKLTVHSNMPPEFEATIWNGGEPIGAAHREQEFTVAPSSQTGAFWVSIASTRDGQEGSTWIRTNPIYVRASPEPIAPATEQDDVASSEPEGEPLFDGETMAGWAVEHDTSSQGAVNVAQLVDGRALLLRFGLGDGGPAASPFVALVRDIPAGLPPGARVAFEIRSEQPMRVSLQVRAPGGAEPGERWQTSLYAEPTPRAYSIPIAVLTPAGAAGTPHAPFQEIRSLLFVVDSLNTRPGASSRLWVSRPALAR
ncbi:MAG: PHP domain-containing protein [Acidobacteria bacterium]|nr:PHP domain-containing protein [Acidobacteriota bacterium]